MTTPVANPDSENKNQDRAIGKFLTFFLGKEEYGTEILKVQEIIGWIDITPVPHVPDFIRGVMNLRGMVIPVVDLRIKLGLPPVPVTAETCVIVTHTSRMRVGVIVDRVCEVVTIAEGQVQAVPSFGGNINTEYLLGIGKQGGRIRLLLDIEKVLATDAVINFHPAVSGEVA